MLALIKIDNVYCIRIAYQHENSSTVVDIDACTEQQDFSTWKVADGKSHSETMNHDRFFPPTSGLARQKTCQTQFIS